MKLYDLSTTVNEEGTTIVLVSGRISDHIENDEQQETITFQLAIHAPTVRNGALLRMQALQRVSDIAGQLAKEFERLGSSH